MIGSYLAGRTFWKCALQGSGGADLFFDEYESLASPLSILDKVQYESMDNKQSGKSERRTLNQ